MLFLSHTSLKSRMIYCLCIYNHTNLLLYATAAAVDTQNVLQLTQEMTVSKMSETVRVKIHFRHTVNYLKKLGVPANNSIQVRIHQPLRTDS